MLLGWSTLEAEMHHIKTTLIHQTKLQHTMLLYLMDMYNS